MTTTVRADQTIARLFEAIDTLAAGMLDGSPRKDDNGQRLTYDGVPMSTPGFRVASMDCPIADALATALMIGGHVHAARMVIAAHSESDDEAGHDAHYADVAGWQERLAYADRYLADLV